MPYSTPYVIAASSWPHFSERPTQASQLPFYAIDEAQAKTIFMQFCIPVAGQEMSYSLYVANSELLPTEKIAEAKVTSPPHQQ